MEERKRSQDPPCQVQGLLDGWSHVVVFVLSEAATEENMGFGVGKGSVLGV